MKRTVSIILAVLFVSIVAFVLYTLELAGTFRSLSAHGPVPLRVIEGFSGGTEDVVFRPGGREAFVSSADFRDATAPGAIFLVDVHSGALRDVTPDVDFPLRPHGIDLWVRDAVERLFVVNHRRGTGFSQGLEDVMTQHSIDVFDVAHDGTLSLVTSHLSAELVSPNDVAAADGERFYVTNDHAHEPGAMRVAEDYLRLALGNVLYFDGQAFRQVHSGTRYANGIIVSADSKTVYLTETIGGHITRFARNVESGNLSKVDESERIGGLDNLAFDSDGNLWATAHPKLLTFSAHARDGATRSPSQALRIQPKDGTWQIDEIYLNMGDPISGVSIAAPGDGVVVLGAVLDPRLVVLPAP